MPRLFVAIDMPPEVKKQMESLQIAIPTARWVRPEQMHLTLRFIGADVPIQQVEPVHSALAAVQAGAFPMKLHGVGRFPPKEHQAARVLWVGVARQPALMELQRKIEVALESVGIPPEGRDFSAHITLARLKTRERLPQVQKFLHQYADFASVSFPVTEFILYESVLSPQGPSYRHAGVYPLVGG